MRYITMIAEALCGLSIIIISTMSVSSTKLSIGNTTLQRTTINRRHSHSIHTRFIFKCTCWNCRQAISTLQFNFKLTLLLRARAGGTIIRQHQSLSWVFLIQQRELSGTFLILSSNIAPIIGFINCPLPIDLDSTSAGLLLQMARCWYLTIYCSTNIKDIRVIFFNLNKLNHLIKLPHHIMLHTTY